MPTLDFKGKQFVYAHHLSVPFRQLNVDESKSMPSTDKKDGKATLDDNLIIHGDNLHALKALLPKYAGKVKCIYIDPPYNTGKEGWCYNDNVNAPMMKEWLKKEGNPVDKEDLERHDKWLCMMWPRLQLLRELLADDGFLFVSIDENEVNSLKFLLNEIFGEKSIAGEFIWNTKHSQQQGLIATYHEYILVYTKSDSNQYDNFKSDKGGLITAGALKKISSANPESDFDFPAGTTCLMKDGQELSGTYGDAEKVTVKKGRFVVENQKLKYPVTLSAGWTNKKMMAEFFDGKKVIDTKGQTVTDFFFNSTGKLKIQKKRTKETPSSILDSFGTTSQSTKLLSEILPDNDFDRPKPPNLIQYLISMVTDYESDDIVLDSFAGSGTTAHAVLALNKEDGGNRKFILVEMEDYASDITAERVRRVIKGVPNAKDDALKNGLGGSFTYCDLGEEINIENLLSGGKLPTFEELARYAFYTATGLTLDDVQSGADYFVGETENSRVHVIYKPDVNFLRSGDSALNMPLAKSIAAAREDSKAGGGKNALVFATHKFMGQKELTEMGITYCQLPYAIHRIMGD